MLASLRIQRRFKLLLLLLLAMAAVLAFWFAVSVYGYTPNNAINLFISLCLQYLFAFATYPLYVEAAVEVTYPVPEGIHSHAQCHNNYLKYSIWSISLPLFGLSIVAGSSAGVMNILSHAATLLFQVINSKDMILQPLICFKCMNISYHYPMSAVNRPVCMHIIVTWP